MATRTEFCWNLAKAASNYQKHGVAFDIAKEALSDPFRFDELDENAAGEMRWRSIAMLDGILIFFIVHTSWEDDGVHWVRLISARLATPRERRKYEQNRFQGQR
jgi:uncharacterized protein